MERETTVAPAGVDSNDDHRWWLALAAVLSAIPALRMALWVRGGSVVQFADYWAFAEATFRTDGGLAFGSLWHWQGAHLISMPQVLYWVNMRLFGGSNITLGTFVLLVALGQVALFGSWVARTSGLPGAVKVTLVAAASALVFTPHGAWTFLHAMSGTAWLVANLLVIGAITLMHRGRVLLAIGLAMAATVTYGTGLLVWPTIVVVAAWGQPTLSRAVRAVLPPIAVAIPVLSTYLLLRASEERPTIQGPGSLTLIHDTATVVGGIAVADAGRATWLGGIIIALVVVFGVLASRSMTIDGAPWIGLATYALLGAGIIAYSRHIPGSGGSNLLSSRYTPIAGLVWLSLLALVAMFACSPHGNRTRALRPAAVATAIGAVALLAAVTGIGEVRSIQDQEPRQQQLADALRVGVAEGGAWLVFEPFPDLTPLLSAIGHHPFDSRYHGGCDLLGTTLGADAVEPLPAGVRVGKTSAQRNPNMTSAVIVGSWLGPGEGDVDCVAVVDGSGEVVGVGHDGQDAIGRPRANGLWGIAPVGSTSYGLVVRLEGSHTLYSLPPGAVPPE